MVTISDEPKISSFDHTNMSGSCCSNVNRDEGTLWIPCMFGCSTVLIASPVLDCDGSLHNLDITTVRYLQTFKLEGS